MYHFSRLIFVALLLASSLSQAAFKPIVTPRGYSAGKYNTSVGSGTHTAAGIALEGELILAGQAAKVPLLLPLATGAASVAASLLFKSPQLLAAAAVAEWLAGECLEPGADGWLLTCGPEVGTPSTGLKYRYSIGSQTTEFKHSWADACSVGAPLFFSQFPTRIPNGAAYVNGSNQCVIPFKLTPTGSDNNAVYTGLSAADSACPVGYYVTASGCVATPTYQPVTETQFAERVADETPLPVGFPFAVPGEYPVGTPVINNGSAMQVPTGMPVPDAGTSPQTYTQPIATVTPANTAADPLRVDVQPGTISVTTPQGMTSPVTTPTATATATSGSSVEVPDFCQLHPESIACASMGTLEPVAIPNENINLAITPDSGWGPSSASCPAPKSVTVQGVTLEFSLQMICDVAVMIRPFFIGFSWITATMIFIGMARKGDM